jgi:uncharacterized protein YecE (DUF72 family)
LRKKAKIWIGCSGWNYEHWRGRFYPAKGFSARQYFEFYAKHFDTVEINNTFYRLPSAKIFKVWESQAPQGFLYSVKANRYLTHVKKLKEAKDSLQLFLKRTRLLKEHLGPILYQLPPRWNFNRERLESFLELLPRNLLHVFEFRHQSWLSAEVLELLKTYGVCFCAHDFPGLKVPRQAVGPAAYVRFHGADQKYQGAYSKSSLQKWWNWMEQQLDVGRDVFVYFNNDVGAHAVSDALALKKKVSQRCRP